MLKKLTALAVAIMLILPVIPAFALDTEATLDGLVVVPISAYKVNELSVPAPTVICSTVSEVISACDAATPGTIIGITSGTYEMYATHPIYDYDYSAKFNFSGKDDVVLRSVTGNPDDVILVGSGFHKRDPFTDPVDELFTLQTMQKTSPSTASPSRIQTATA